MVARAIFRLDVDDDILYGADYENSLADKKYVVNLLRYVAYGIANSVASHVPVWSPKQHIEKLEQYCEKYGHKMKTGWHQRVQEVRSEEETEDIDSAPF